MNKISDLHRYDEDFDLDLRSGRIDFSLDCSEPDAILECSVVEEDSMEEDCEKMDMSKLFETYKTADINTRDISVDVPPNLFTMLPSNETGKCTQRPLTLDPQSVLVGNMTCSPIHAPSNKRFFGEEIEENKVDEGQFKIENLATVMDGKRTHNVGLIVRSIVPPEIIEHGSIEDLCSCTDDEATVESPRNLITSTLSSKKFAEGCSFDASPPTQGTHPIHAVSAKCCLASIDAVITNLVGQTMAAMNSKKQQSSSVEVVMSSDTSTSTSACTSIEDNKDSDVKFQEPVYASKLLTFLSRHNGERVHSIEQCKIVSNSHSKNIACNSQSKNITSGYCHSDVNETIVMEESLATNQLATDMCASICQDDSKVHNKLSNMKVAQEDLMDSKSHDVDPVGLSTLVKDCNKVSKSMMKLPKIVTRMIAVAMNAMLYLFLLFCGSALLLEVDKCAGESLIARYRPTGILYAGQGRNVTLCALSLGCLAFISNLFPTKPVNDDTLNASSLIPLVQSHSLWSQRVAFLSEILSPFQDCMIRVHDELVDVCELVRIMGNGLEMEIAEREMAINQLNLELAALQTLRPPLQPKELQSVRNNDSISPYQQTISLWSFQRIYEYYVLSVAVLLMVICSYWLSMHVIKKIQ